MERTAREKREAAEKAMGERRGMRAGHFASSLRPSNKLVATFSKDFLSVLLGYELALETHVTAHQRKGAAGLVTLVAAARKWMHACVACLQGSIC